MKRRALKRATRPVNKKSKIDTEQNVAGSQLATTKSLEERVTRAAAKKRKVTIEQRDSNEEIRQSEVKETQNDQSTSYESSSPIRIINEDTNNSFDSFDPEDNSFISPDAIEDYYFEEDHYWLSHDQVIGMKDATVDGPKLKDWVEVDPKLPIQVTVAKARREVWNCGKTKLKASKRILKIFSYQKI